MENQRGNNFFGKSEIPINISRKLNKRLNSEIPLINHSQPFQDERYNKTNNKEIYNRKVATNLNSQRSPNMQFLINDKNSLENDKRNEKSQSEEQHFKPKIINEERLNDEISSIYNSNAQEFLMNNTRSYKMGVLSSAVSESTNKNLKAHLLDYKKNIKKNEELKGTTETIEESKSQTESKQENSMNRSNESDLLPEYIIKEIEKELANILFAASNLDIPKYRDEKIKLIKCLRSKDSFSSKISWIQDSINAIGNIINIYLKQSKISPQSKKMHFQNFQSQGSEKMAQKDEEAILVDVLNINDNSQMRSKLDTASNSNRELRMDSVIKVISNSNLNSQKTPFFSGADCNPKTKFTSSINDSNKENSTNNYNLEIINKGLNKISSSFTTKIENQEERFHIDPSLSIIDCKRQILGKINNTSSKIKKYVDLFLWNKWSKININDSPALFLLFTADYFKVISSFIKNSDIKLKEVKAEKTNISKMVEVVEKEVDYLKDHKEKIQKSKVNNQINKLEKIQKNRVKEEELLITIENLEKTIQEQRAFIKQLEDKKLEIERSENRSFISNT